MYWTIFTAYRFKNQISRLNRMYKSRVHNFLTIKRLLVHTLNHYVQSDHRIYTVSI